MAKFTKRISFQRLASSIGVALGNFHIGGIGSTAGGTLLTGVPTKIPFTTILFGDPTFADLPNDRFVAPVDGLWSFSFSMNGAAEAIGQQGPFFLDVEFRINGAVDPTLGTRQVDSTTKWGFNVGGASSLIATDFVEVFVTNGHDRDLTLIGEQVFVYTLEIPDAIIPQ